MIPEVFSQLFSFVKFALMGGFSLIALFMVLIALPRSPFRDFTMQGLLWIIVLACGFLWLSPVDFIPLLPFDDLVAGGAGLSAAAVAIAQKIRHVREDATRAAAEGSPPPVRPVATGKAEAA